MQYIAFKTPRILNNVSRPLSDFQDQPPPPRNIGVTQVRTGRRGRPRYVIDLDNAVQLHNNGSSWESVADALGVSERLLFYRLEKAGIQTARPSYTDISDDDLDELISAISLNHPLAGGYIVQGHLKERNVNVPIRRVQESLKRVDEVAVLFR